VAAFVWGERLGRRELLPALAATAVAGVAGVLAAPRLDIHRPVLNYQSIANSLSPGGIETFQWYQGYGPYAWPTDGQTVLQIKARHPGFWKTENLDDFDGRGWVQAQNNLGSPYAGPPPTPAPSPLATATWTETLRVSIGTMYTTNVVASGTAQTPRDVPGGVTAGPSAGTWLANRQLGPGDAYVVKVYAPDPSPAQLENAGLSYPDSLGYYRSMYLPVTGSRSAAGTIVFPSFGDSTVLNPAAAYIASELDSSSYAPAYRLAQRLASGATTPYAFVARVEDYLLRNYAYSTNAPISANPLETFLFKEKFGYCQQFAGAMALLLRMGGIPARVAVGFTPGSFSSSSGTYNVVDSDAHSWVEAWFPTYGWVAFNPTPSSAAGLRGPIGGGSNLPLTPATAAKDHATVSGATVAAHQGGGSTPALAAIGATVALLLGLVGLVARTRSRRPVLASGDELLAELERALRRSSIEFTPATTLAHLERRFRHTPGAAAYVRAVGRARYADTAEEPTPAERRALRAQLAEGRGTFGRLRAIWALPPRPQRLK
jgi:transglutaminase-like putative cysteine protease